MLINLWSTQRTGSHWYAKKLLVDLSAEYPSAKILKEPFNRNNLNRYRLKVGELPTTNFQEYVADSYYDDYQVSDEGEIIVVKVYAPRIREVDDELRYRRNMIFHSLNHEKHPVIIHNHVNPEEVELYQEMLDFGTDNVYLHRLNFVEQLSSFAIAFSTKKYCIIGSQLIHHIADLNNTAKAQVSRSALEGLYKKIKFWDSLDKLGKVVAYEDIDFDEYPSLTGDFPIKQNATSSFEKCSTETQDIIMELYLDYKNKTIKE